MEGFIRQLGQRVIGALHGFDRLRIRGTKRLLNSVRGMAWFLHNQGVRLTCFKGYVEQVTRTVRDATQEIARKAGRPIVYLPSPRTDKEQTARDIAQQDGITEGLIAILSCVEPCRSYHVRRDKETGYINLHLASRKCLHCYHYFLHPQWGLMHVRLQSWFPFTMHVCLNGREWLARQMDRQGLAYRRRRNCMVWVQDVPAAQALLHAQLQTDWVRELEALVPLVNPAEGQLFPGRPIPYYWSADESEWASDLMFRCPEDLGRVYPRLIQRGLTTLGSPDVMRFLGRKTPLEGTGNFQGEVVTDLRHRPEGMRIKHSVNHNSVKMYDKQGTVLRIETTINDAHDIKVYRPKEGEPDGPKAWRILRKGVADLHRRAQVSQQANERYAKALGPIDLQRRLGEVGEQLSKPVRWKGRRVRGLHPLAQDDAALLEAAGAGQYALCGFRNADIRQALYGPKPQDPKQRRSQSAAVTRKLRLLRAHGLIRKLPHTHRYRPSEAGRAYITLILLARQADSTHFAPAA